MSIQIVYGTSGTGKSTYIFNQINEQIKQKSPYKIKVITPEQFSYTAEQKLLETSSSQSMISAEVITFARMAYRILGEVGKKTRINLSGSGKAMLIDHILLTENNKFSKKPVAGADMEPAIKKFLGDVLNAMGMQAEVKVVIDENEGSVDIELVGENMGVLIGKRGQTLDSLQYLVSLVANKEADGYFRVKLDTENYRAYERRIIHSALQNDKYVATRSEGEEPFRHVVVYLRKNV